MFNSHMWLVATIVGNVDSHPKLFNLNIVTRAGRRTQGWGAAILCDITSDGRSLSTSNTVFPWRLNQAAMSVNYSLSWASPCATNFISIISL